MKKFFSSSGVAGSTAFVYVRAPLGFKVILCDFIPVFCSHFLCFGVFIRASMNVAQSTKSWATWCIFYTIKCFTDRFCAIYCRESKLIYYQSDLAQSANEWILIVDASHASHAALRCNRVTIYNLRALVLSVWYFSSRSYFFGRIFVYYFQIALECSVHGCGYKTKWIAMQACRQSGIFIYILCVCIRTLFIRGKNCAARTALTPFACVHDYGVNDFEKKAISSVKLFIIYGVLLW